MYNEKQVQDVIEFIETRKETESGAFAEYVEDKIMDSDGIRHTATERGSDDDVKNHIDYFFYQCLTCDTKTSADVKAIRKGIKGMLRHLSDDVIIELERRNPPSGKTNTGSVHGKQDMMHHHLYDAGKIWLLSLWRKQVENWIQEKLKNHDPKYDEDENFMYKTLRYYQEVTTKDNSKFVNVPVDDIVGQRELSYELRDITKFYVDAYQDYLTDPKCLERFRVDKTKKRSFLPPS